MNSRSHILVVDDNEQLLEDLRFAAAGPDLEDRVVVEATSDKEAIERIRADAFDLIITDLEMSEHRRHAGLDVLKVARSVDPDAQVIIVTAWGDKNVSVQSMAAGAADYVERNSPGTNFLEVLKAKIDRALTYRHLITKEKERLRKIAGFVNVWFPAYPAGLLPIDKDVQVRVNVGPLRQGMPPLLRDRERPTGDDLLTAIASVDIVLSCRGATISPLRQTLKLPPSPDATIEFTMRVQRPGISSLVVILMVNNDEIHRAEFAFAAHEDHQS